ncbi:MAG: NYN domain-containing protein [Candidatus ainarchaeum sp.]|nr:NYN domain-containing protein [Candidatus ainarchaeum sp.]
MFLKESFLKLFDYLLINNYPIIANATIGSIYRVSIFIDGSNLYHSLVNNFQTAKIDLEKFSIFLSMGLDLINVYYYTSPISNLENKEGYISQQKFLSKIQKIPKLILFLWRLEKHNGVKIEKGVDVKLVTDLILGAVENKFDIAIIVSNDSDFVPAIKEVQKLNKKVWNVNFPKRKSYHLNQICNKTINVNSILKFQN